MKLIKDIMEISDLKKNERAYPEKGIEYTLWDRLYGDRDFVVSYIVRRDYAGCGPAIYACDKNGRSETITSGIGEDYAPCYLRRHSSDSPHVAADFNQLSKLTLIAEELTEYKKVSDLEKREEIKRQELAKKNKQLRFIAA